MHLTLVVTLLVTLCYSSPFDFENYNIQWEVPLPVGNVPDLSLPEESNLSDVTAVIPVVILADMYLTPVDQDMADILDDRKANLTGVPTEFWIDNFVDDKLNVTDFSVADSGLNLTYDLADSDEPSPAQMTLTLNLNFPKILWIIWWTRPLAWLTRQSMLAVMLTLMTDLTPRTCQPGKC